MVKILKRKSKTKSKAPEKEIKKTKKEKPAKKPVLRKAIAVGNIRDKFAEYAKRILNRRISKNASKGSAARDAKYPISPSPVIQKIMSEHQYELPGGYGEDRLVLLVRDPHWMFAYWELTLANIENLRQSLNGKFADKNLTLRMFVNNDREFYDINVYSAGIRGNWYINVGKPDTSYFAQVGYQGLDGRFYPLVTSNVVKTPSDRISDVIDEEWMIPDWAKLFALSGGLTIGRGSMEISELLSKYLRELVTSQAPSSFSSQVRQK